MVYSVPQPAPMPNQPRQVLPPRKPVRRHNTPLLLSVAIGVGIGFFAAANDSKPNDSFPVVIGLIAFVSTFLYLIPAIIAYSRRTVTRGLNFALNIAFGWTFLGWVLCLAMAVTAAQDRPRKLTIHLPNGNIIEGEVD